ncbi:hypothetical protein DFJ43DRAFT_1169288, partial [Lentinula guzmanii]
VLVDRITVATEEELAREAEFCIGTDTIIINESDDSMDTIPVLAPLPPLPSPLLCPRRAFLASLILASKFTQDKCYSNRAWAMLSGLQPREIGRC